MLKLVVLCAVLAVAVAEPGALLAAPLAYSPGVLPAAVTPLASRFALPSPYYYSYPSPALPLYSHFIKKRSAPLLAAPYYAALPTPARIVPALPAPAPLLHAAYSAPALPLYSHFIKKRSAPLLAASAYIAPASYSHQSRVDVHHSAPLISSYTTPLAYSTPFYKYFY